MIDQSLSALAHRRILISRICLRGNSACGSAFASLQRRSLASRSRATKQFTIPLDVAPMTDRWCNGTATIEVTEAKKNSVRLLQRSLKNAIMIEISLSGPFAVFESSSTRAGVPCYITRKLYRKSPKCTLTILEKFSCLSSPPLIDRRK